MFYNYLITAWRNIIKNGIFSVINIFGLAIGLMSCILIMLFLNNLLKLNMVVITLPGPTSFLFSILL